MKLFKTLVNVLKSEEVKGAAKEDIQTVKDTSKEVYEVSKLVGKVTISKIKEIKDEVKRELDKRNKVQVVEVEVMKNDIIVRK